MLKCSLIVISALALSGCGTAEDSARAAFRARLADAKRLDHDEVTRFVAAVVGAVSGRVIRVRDESGTRTLDGRERAEALAVLSGRFPIEDGGVRKEGGTTLRGLSGPGTPAHTEADAAQTLWIDVDTMLPRRFELKFAVSGMGDVELEFIYPTP